MLKTRMLTVIAAIALLTALPIAQERPTAKPVTKPEPAGQQPEQPAPRPKPAPRPEPQGQAVNVRLDLTISDQSGSNARPKKEITMIVADRQFGSIRSKGRVMVGGGGWREVTINVDARPVLLPEGSVRVDLGIEYQPTMPLERGSGEAVPTGAPLGPDPFGSNLNERIAVVLDSGKPLVISQAVDPSSDRRISVELKATIIR